MTNGTYMRAEIAEAPGVFAKTLESAISTKAHRALNELSIPQIMALYTIARGSSDAAANILSYEFMRELGKPMTSLPPSVFSVGHGVSLPNTLVVLVSQSGASDDLVRSAKGARESGATVIAITNEPKSPVEAHADITLAIGAGPELAVPATKTVIGSVGAGMALLAVLNPLYISRARAAAKAVAASGARPHPQAAAITKALTEASHVYVIGRDTGYGAALELALKIKETCALHAEAYSASEVLHGPLQLATKPLLTIILDTGTPDTQNSLDTAETRLRASGGPVFRLRPMDVECSGLTPAAAAALLLCITYPIVLETAIALGYDPDRPATLSKVTQTT